MSRGTLAALLARLNSYREAREIADQCSRAADRLAAYTAILREYHIEHNPSLAQLFAEEEKDEDWPLGAYAYTGRAGDLFRSL